MIEDFFLPNNISSIGTKQIKPFPIQNNTHKLYNKLLHKAYSQNSHIFLTQANDLIILVKQLLKPIITPSNHKWVGATTEEEIGVEAGTAAILEP